MLGFGSKRRRRRKYHSWWGCIRGRNQQFEDCHSECHSWSCRKECSWKIHSPHLHVPFRVSIEYHKRNGDNKNAFCAIDSKPNGGTKCKGWWFTTEKWPGSLHVHRPHSTLRTLQHSCNISISQADHPQTGILGNILTTGLQLCHRYWFPNDPNMYPFPSANNPFQNSLPCPERQMENYPYSILPQLCPLSKSLFLLHSKLLTNFSWFLCKPHNNSAMTSLTPLHDFFELTEQIE